jgi:hypothetical protein
MHRTRSSGSRFCLSSRARVWAPGCGRSRRTIRRDPSDQASSARWSVSSATHAPSRGWLSPSIAGRHAASGSARIASRTRCGRQRAFVAGGHGAVAAGGRAGAAHGRAVVGAGRERERRSAQDPGQAFCDLAVMLADGGRCVSEHLLPDAGTSHHLQGEPPERRRQLTGIEAKPASGPPRVPPRGGQGPA